MSEDTKGWLLGIAGVLAFSLSLPMTRLGTLGGLDGAFVGFARIALAALLAAFILLVWGGPRPAGREWASLAVVAFGVVFGFPVLTSIAMESVPAAHGAVVIGVLTLTTAMFGVWLAGERPSIWFWAVGLAGAAATLAYALLQGGGALRWGHALLLLATICAGLGYAEGARLAPRLGAGQTVCWALILSGPLALPFALWRLPADPAAIGATAWLGLAYVAIVSQVLGFFAWYRGLALGGIARVGQTQLAQPFLTIFFSAWLLGEALDAATLGFAALIVALVVLGRFTRVARR